MTTSPPRALVIAGGELHTTPAVDPDDLVIAADSGYDHALALGIEVDLLVGDLDSISATGLEHARRFGVSVEEHAVDKDNTDLELALQAAIVRGATTIDIHGGEGGRLGHLLGVALSTARPTAEPVDISWHTRTGIVRAAMPQHPAGFTTAVGEIVTLIPIGDAHGVTTKGLRWSLDDATLAQGTSRGVSNEATSQQVNVEVGEGTVLVIAERPISQ